MASAPTIPHDPCTSGLRILLVEDHATNLRLCELMLEGLGHRASVALNGRQAVEAVKQQVFDIILMDCHLPEMDGYEATRRIRAWESAQAAPVAMPACIIAVTANALVGERERCLDAGMDDYLTKPFTSIQLAKALGRSPVLRSVVNIATAASGECGVSPFSSEQPQQMAEELGWDEFEGLSRDFLAGLPAELERLPLSLSAGTRQELERSVHSLKGISLTLGLTALSEALLGLERAAATEESGLLALRINALAAPALSGEKALREWLRAGRSARSPATTLSHVPPPNPLRPLHETRNPR